MGSQMEFPERRLLLLRGSPEDSLCCLGIMRGSRSNADFTHSICTVSWPWKQIFESPIRCYRRKNRINSTAVYTRYCAHKSEASVTPLGTVDFISAAKSCAWLCVGTIRQVLNQRRIICYAEYSSQHPKHRKTLAFLLLSVPLIFG